MSLAYRSWLTHFRHEGPTVEVTVGTGTEERTWTLPKALLSHHSRFFRAAFEQPFKEGLENKISLPEDNPLAFEVFHDWLLLKRLPENFTDIADLEWTETGSHVYLTYQIWVLGDKLLASGFKNAAMKEIWNVFKPYNATEYLSPEEVAYCLANTSPTSLLREWVLDVVISRWATLKENHRTTHELWEETFEEHEELYKLLMLHNGNFGPGFKRSIKHVSGYLESKD
jgi:hypothetical protein